MIRHNEFIFRRHFSHRLLVILGGLLVIIGGVSILVRQNYQAHAAPGTIFDKNNDKRYFGRGTQANVDVVLPPMYHYQEQGPGYSGVQYSVNMTEFTGISDLSPIWNLYGKSRGDNFVNIPDVKTFFNRIESKAKGIETHYKDYEGYLHRRDQINKRVPNVYLEPIDACVEMRAGHANVGRGTYDYHWEFCKQWLVQGYRFVMYSAAGIPQSKSNDVALFEKQYQELKNDPNKKLTIQWMDGGNSDGGFNYYAGSGKPTTERAGGNMRIYNTAINAGAQDIVRSNYHIAPSVAIILWDKNGESPSNPAEPLWVLRLRCANPIATAVNERKANLSVKVTGVPPQIVLPDRGDVKVKFIYELSKNVKRYPKHTMHYVFSSQPQKSLNPRQTKVVKTSNSVAKAVGSVLPDNKAIDIPTDFPDLALTYEEEVIINRDNHGNVWKKIDNTRGQICRHLGGKPKPGQHSFPADLVKSLNKTSQFCITILLSAQPDDNSQGGIFVDPMVPAIASVTDTIYPDYRGINSYAIRPKQWRYNESNVSGNAACAKVSADTAKKRAEGDAKNNCSKICKEAPENKISCSIPGDRMKSSAGGCCVRWGTCCDEDGCWTCCRVRGHSGSASGVCEHKVRQQTAKTVITKIIYKPETFDLSANSPMTLSGSNKDDENAPCAHYLSKLGGRSAKCDTYRTSSAPFDNTSLYSLSRRTGTPYGKMLTIISPIHGGLRGDAKATQGKGTGIVDALYDVEHLSSGSVVCFGASMYPWSKEFSKADYEAGAKIEDKYRWAHSEPKCFTVSKKPFFSVENGMVVTSGGIVTNINRRWSDPNSKTAIFRAGSWAEYSAIANQQIANLFATNAYTSGRVRVTGGSSNTYQKWHRLTFANTPSYGHYAGDATGELTDPIAFFNNLPTGNYANTTIHRPGGNTIGGNLSGVYIYNGDTTITSNITAGSSGNSGAVGDLSQAVIVVNGNLTINSNVTHVDAWLLVSGTLYTSDRPVTESAISKQGIGDTENALVINGPVRANEIKLRRTAGSGFKSPMNSLGNLNNPNEQFRMPAETFRLTPDTYVWSYYNSLDKGKVQTVYLREVAPRY